MRNIRYRESKVYANLHLAFPEKKRRKENGNARENKVSRDNNFTRSRLVGYDITVRDETTRHATSNTRGVAISVCKLLPTATALGVVARSKVITVFPPNIATRS